MHIDFLEIVSILIVKTYPVKYRIFPDFSYFEILGFFIKILRSIEKSIEKSIFIILKLESGVKVGRVQFQS